MWRRFLSSNPFPNSAVSDSANLGIRRAPYIARSAPCCSNSTICRPISQQARTCMESTARSACPRADSISPRNWLISVGSVSWFVGRAKRPSCWWPLLRQPRGLAWRSVSRHLRIGRQALVVNDGEGSHGGEIALRFLLIWRAGQNCRFIGLIGLGCANPTCSDSLALLLIATFARGVWARGLFYGNFSWYPARGWIAALTVIARSGYATRQSQ